MMADSGADAARVKGLIENLGLAAVAEQLGLTGEEVSGVVEGRYGLDERLSGKVRELCEVLGGVFGVDAAEVASSTGGGDDLEAYDVAEQDGGDWGDGERFGVDLDGDGVADVRVAPVPARPGITWVEEQQRQRDSLRRSLAYAQMMQFRLNMTRAEYVSAMGMVTQIELALITHFHESVPDPKENWDAGRRWRETSRRLARLRWIQEEQRKEYGGVKGLLNRVIGKKQVTGKELFDRMVAEADWMVAAMRDGVPDSDVVSQVMGYVGMEDNRNGLGPG